MVSYLYRTAQQPQPCCLPALGKYAGAGRTGLTKCKIKKIKKIPRKKHFIYICVTFLEIVLSWKLKDLVFRLKRIC